MSFWNGHRWEAQSPPGADVKSATPSRAKRVGVAVLEAALVTALTFGLIAGSVFAGKGGGGSGSCHGKRCNPTYTASVAVAPNPVSSYGEFQISGCGYAPGGGVQFNMYTSSATAVWGGVADGNGCLWNAAGWANSAGTARLDVLAGSTTLVASTTFTVQ